MYRSVLEKIANEHGFESIIDYQDPKLEQLFQDVSFLSPKSNSSFQERMSPSSMLCFFGTLLVCLGEALMTTQVNF